jgi:hypothetical protein
VQATVWSEQMQSDLRSAFRTGKYGAALRAFPFITRGQVQSAIRRFVFDFDTANAEMTADVIAPAEARAPSRLQRRGVSRRRCAIARGSAYGQRLRPFAQASVYCGVRRTGEGAGRRVRAGVKIYARARDPAAGLTEMLAAAGFEAGDVETVLILDLDTVECCL